MDGSNSIGRSSVARRAFPVSNAGISAAFEHVEAVLREEDVSDAVVHRLSVIIDELCANMIRHDPVLTPEHEFDLAIAVAGKEVVLEISDPGEAFNPLEFRHEVVPEIGGHGISLIKSLSSAVSYVRADDRNRLKVTLLIED